MAIQVRKNNDETRMIRKLVTLEDTQSVVSHVCKCGYKEIVDVTRWVPVSELDDGRYVAFGGNKVCPDCGDVARLSKIIWKSKTELWDNYYPILNSEKGKVVKDTIEKEIGRNVTEKGTPHLKEIVSGFTEVLPYFQAVIPPRMSNMPGRSATSIVSQIASNKEAEKRKLGASNRLYYSNTFSAQAQISKEVIISKLENYGTGTKGRTLILKNIPEFVGEDIYCGVDLFMDGDIPVIVCLMEDIVSKDKILKKLGLLAVALQSSETSDQGYLLCIEAPGHYHDSEFCAIKIDKEEVSEWLFDRVRNIKQRTEKLRGE